jgi:hypothetical protein
MNFSGIVNSIRPYFECCYEFYNLYINSKVIFFNNNLNGKIEESFSKYIFSEVFFSKYLNFNLYSYVYMIKNKYYFKDSEIQELKLIPILLEFKIKYNDCEYINLLTKITNYDNYFPVKLLIYNETGLMLFGKIFDIEISYLNDTDFLTKKINSDEINNLRIYQLFD